MTKLIFCLLTAVFFISGACGLLYEIVWLKMAGLIFGNTTYAVSTVLAAFMAGLGLGSFYLGNRIDKKGHPVLIYGLLEIGTGVYCMLSPLFWLFIQNVFVSYSAHFSPGMTQSGLIRFFLSFTVMFIPTFLMGGTLPVLVKFFARSTAVLGRQLGWLYAINTAGAAIGVIFASFFAVYHLGVYLTVFLAAGANMIIGAGAVLAVKSGFVPPLNSPLDFDAPVPAHVQERLSFTSKIVLPGFGLSGFCSMAYELLWTKILALSVGSSVYSFAIMLLTFLTGIAIGSFLISRWSKIMRLDFSVFAFIQLLIAFSVLAGMRFLDQMPFYYLRFFAAAHGNSAVLQFGKYLLCAIIMLIPSILIGAAFPVVTQIFSTGLDRSGRTIGRAYLINTIGCIFGSFCAGFIFVPWLGVQKSFLLIAGINLLAGVWVLGSRLKRLSKPRLTAACGICAFIFFGFILVKPWSKGVLTSNIYINPMKYINQSKYEIMDTAAQSEILFYQEGLNGTVCVKKTQDDFLRLSINANVDASSGDMFTQLLLAHLPMQLAGNPKNVLNIGMGCGATVGAAALYPCERIDSVELEAGVFEAAKFFSNENRNVLQNPKVHLITNDARNYLLVNDRKYDVIMSEPSSLWMSGIANLFSKEQFLLMQSRLNKGGVVCQWLNTYSMSKENIKMIVKTFCSVFPHAELWNSTMMDLLLIGSNKPIEFDMDRINRRMNSNPLIKDDLSSFHVYDAAGLLSCFLLNRPELENMAYDAVVHSDFFPKLEYESPANFYQFENRVIENRQMIQQAVSTWYPDNLKIPADDHNFYNSLSLALLENGWNDRAKTIIDLPRNLQPGNWNALLNEGVLYYLQGDYSAAQRVLETFVSQEPSSAKGYYYLGLTMEALGKKEAALTAYKKSYENASGNKEIVLSYAESLLAGLHPEAAVQVLNNYSGKEGLKTTAGIKLANAFLMMRQPQVSVNILYSLISSNPYYYSLYEDIGLCYKIFGNWKGVQEVYEQAREKLPFHVQNYSNLAEAYHHLNMEKEEFQAQKQIQYLGRFEKLKISF